MRNEKIIACSTHGKEKFIEPKQTHENLRSFSDIAVSQE